MSDNGKSHFNASKPNRNAAFAYPNVPSGENTALVHPFPVPLSNAQKVGQPSAGSDTTISFQGTPTGFDKNPKSHVQPAGPVNRGGLPGEQDDPRLC